MANDTFKVITTSPHQRKVRKPKARKKSSPEAPGAVLDVGDVFSLDVQQEIYRESVMALRDLAKNGNDNARMGAAKQLASLFAKTAQQQAQAKKVLVSWRNPLAGESDVDKALLA